MSCTITSVQVTGKNLDSAGMPTSYQLAFRVAECEYVDIEIFDVAGGTSVYRQPNVRVSGPIDSNGLRLLVTTFAPRQAKPCGGTYHVVITCALNRACTGGGDIEITCKPGAPQQTPVPCSNTATLTVQNSDGTLVSLTQSCLPPGAYTITIESPWSENATAQWSVAPMPTSGASITTVVIGGNSERTLTYTLPDTLQPPATARLISATIVDTIPGGGHCISPGLALLPPVHPKECPTSVTLELLRNGTAVPADPLPPGSATNSPTYSNLAAGFYELRVSDPVSTDTDITYEWFSGGPSALQIGTSNLLGVNLAAANSPRQVDVFVRAGDCCPTLHAQATLTMTAESTGTPPAEEPTTETPPETDTPVPPPTLSLCGIIRALLAVALTVLLAAMLFIVCPSLLTPLAVAAASVAALAVAVLLGLALLLCGLGFCGFWGIVIWALRWAIVLGLIIALLLLLMVGLAALPVVMCVALAALGYGIICGLLIVWVTSRGCTIPSGFSWP